LWSNEHPDYMTKLGMLVKGMDVPLPEAANTETLYKGEQDRYLAVRKCAVDSLTGKGEDLCKSMQQFWEDRQE